ncbi:tetratricopeptide repeat protein, partial [Caenimonas sp. SL110]|uniref:tetratricopeptide repeat protein n=1 Tax=Caenimonas sp. SL110 TaxID=1450524 RepID=UPI000653C920
MLADSLGNPVTLEDESVLLAVNDFVEGFIASEARAVNILAAAETDPSAIVQAYAAAVHMFAESRDAPSNARPYLDRALQAQAQSTPREGRFIAAIDAWARGDIPGAIRLHQEQANEHPRDLASLKLGHYHLFNAGDSPGMLAMVQPALKEAGDVCYTHGMAAFAWEQCHGLAEAEEQARQAIAMCRKEPWAHHALAHVMLTQGRIDEGHAFLADVSDTWTGLNSFMVTHNWWHQALFAIEMGRPDEVLALYDQQIWGVAREYSQDQINAVSLLARLELAGVAVGDRWQDVGRYLAARQLDHVLPFLDMQYLYGLARAGLDAKADAMMRGIAAHAAGVPEHAAHAWQQVCVPASRGMLAHARGNWQEAAVELDKALPHLAEIGGSHAQRDLFVRVHRDAVKRSSAQ